MLVIRLQRTGRKNRAEYRVVVAEKSQAVKKKFIEIVGHYLPQRDPKVLEVKTERIEYWISQGAQPSNTVASLCKGLGMKDMERYMSAGKKKRPVKNPTEEPEAPETPAAPAAEEPKAEEPAKEEAPAVVEEPKAEETEAPAAE